MEIKIKKTHFIIRTRVPRPVENLWLYFNDWLIYNDYSVKYTDKFDFDTSLYIDFLDELMSLS